VAAVVRAIKESEVPDYLGCLRTAFLGDREVTIEEADWKAKRMDLSRTFCAFSDGELCGTARTFPVDITVPGGVLRASAVTEVSVLPTHRRQGLLNAMMTAMLDDAVRRAEPVSILTASEWPIYGRFGFGVATERVSVELRTVDARFIAPRTGKIRMIGVHELRSVAPPIYESVRPKIVGCLERDPEWWDDLLNVEVRPGSTPVKNRVRVVWYDDEGAGQGYAVYDTTESWVDGRPVSEIQVREIFWATPEAHRELWRYLSEVDLVAWVRANHRAVDDPLVFELVDGRALRTRARFDHLWLRILDVEATLSGRTYSTPGRVVLEVTEPAKRTCSRFALDGGPDGASAEPTEQPPDIALDLSTLGAAYLGGVSFACLAAAGRLVECVQGSVARADTMFSIDPKPYLTTNF
jgi:predicted acetyltransferase